MAYLRYEAIPDTDGYIHQPIKCGVMESTPMRSAQSGASHSETSTKLL